MNVIFLYGTFINLIGFILMGLDKRKAKKRQWRVLEKTLWFVTIIGGALGLFAGMQVFHHKTKHRHFRVGVPFLIFFQIAIPLYIVLS